MPGGKHENMQAWSPEEDHIIIQMVNTDGPKWSRIVQELPGRTVSSVRNRWQRIEKGRKLREAGVESKNRCHACGEPKRGHVCKAKLGGGPKVAQTARWTSQAWVSTANANAVEVRPRAMEVDEAERRAKAGGLTLVRAGTKTGF